MKIAYYGLLRLTTAEVVAVGEREFLEQLLSGKIFFKDGAYLYKPNGCSDEMFRTLVALIGNQYSLDDEENRISCELYPVEFEIVPLDKDKNIITDKPKKFKATR